MNILLINHYAGSNINGMEYRPFCLAREWVKLGHKVSVVAASYSHLRSKEPYTNGNITRELIEGIYYFWLKTPGYQGNGIGRVLNMIVFSLMLFVQKSKIINDLKPNLVIASSPHPFIIFGARKIARLSNARLVFEVRDLWPLTLIALGGMSHLNPFIILMQWTENYAYRVVNHVISVLPKAKSYMQAHDMSEDKFAYIPNGIDIIEWQNSNKNSVPHYHAEILSKYKQEGCFIVGYAGAHGLSNALHTLIEAAFLLRSQPIAIVLIGQGPEKKALQQRVSQLGLRNVVFLPPVSKTNIPSLLNFMDALFIGWLRNPIYRFGISPNKLLDYMMSGKPVIHAINAGNDLVAESNCGISIPPENPGAIAKAVIKLMNMTRAEREEMGLRGKEYVMAHHNYSVLAKKFLEIFNE